MGLGFDNQTPQGRRQILPDSVSASSRAMKLPHGDGTQIFYAAAVSFLAQAARLPSDHALALSAAVLVYAKRAKATDGSGSGALQELEWNVRAVLCGDGSIGACGRRLESGSIYASRSFRGGLESFRMVEDYYLRLCTGGASILQWAAVPVTALAKKK